MQAVHWQTGLSLSSIHVHTTWLMTVFHLASELTFALSQFMLLKASTSGNARSVTFFISCINACICITGVHTCFLVHKFAFVFVSLI